MSDDFDNEKLTKSLIKKAMGYKIDETVDEYVVDEDTNNLKLVKRKITTKHIPPDINVAKVLIDKLGNSDFDDIKNWSDEKLKKKREEILQEIKKGGQK